MSLDLRDLSRLLAVLILFLNSLFFCLQCFACSVELGSHKKSHNYHIFVSCNSSRFAACKNDIIYMARSAQLFLSYTFYLRSYNTEKNIFLCNFCYCEIINSILCWPASLNLSVPARHWWSDMFRTSDSINFLIKQHSVNLLCAFAECQSYRRWSCWGWCDLCIWCGWSLVCVWGRYAAGCSGASWIRQLVCTVKIGNHYILVSVVCHSQQLLLVGVN